MNYVPSGTGTEVELYPKHAVRSDINHNEWEASAAVEEKITKRKKTKPRTRRSSSLLESRTRHEVTLSCGVGTDVMHAPACRSGVDQTLS